MRAVATVTYKKHGVGEVVKRFATAKEANAFLAELLAAGHKEARAEMAKWALKEQ